MTATGIFVGIDIAKADFVVACRPDGTSWTAPNDPAGIAATVVRTRALAPTLIVLAATGARAIVDSSRPASPRRSPSSPACASG
jgi:hypothetical protein